MKRTRFAAATLVATSMVLAACGGDDESTTDDSTATDDTTADTTADTESTDAAADTTQAAESTEVADTTAAPGTTEAGDDEAAAGDALVIWADELKMDALESIAPAFTEATGIPVEIELVPFEDIREQVTQAAPAGEGPDIFVGAHDWTGELAASGLIDPIDVSAKADQFLEASLQGFNFEGQNYGLPYATEAIALYRNTDLAPEAPATLTDIVTTCEAAAAANCVVMPGGADTADAYHMYPFVSAFGGYIFAFDAETGFDASDVGLDSPEALEGGAVLDQAVAGGYLASTNYDTAKELWLAGDAVYWITGPWELGGVREQTTVPNWDVSLIPQFGDSPAQPFVGVSGFFVSAFSEQSLIAQSFLVDFVATDETMQALYDADPRGTAWQSVLDGLADDPQVQVFGESAANGIPMPNIAQMAAVWGPLGDNLLLVRNGELTGEEALTTAAEAVRSAVAG